MNFFFLTKLFELFRIIIFGPFLIYFPVFFLPKFFLFFYLSRIFFIFLLVNIFLIFRLFFFFKLFSRMIIIIQRFFLVFWFFSIRILAVLILKPLKIFGILIFTSLFANNKLLKLFSPVWELSSVLSSTLYPAFLDSCNIIALLCIFLFKIKSNSRAVDLLNIILACSFNFLYSSDTTHFSIICSSNYSY